MNGFRSQQYGGLLLAWQSVAIGEALLDVVLERDNGGVGPYPGWKSYWFSTTTRLLPEESEGVGRYRYEVLARPSGSRLLLVGRRRRVIEYLVNEGPLSGISPRLKAVRIDVDSLVRDLTDAPSEYSLSFVHAKAPAFGQSLRSTSFHGDDLAESAWFREAIPLLVFTTCGLRRVAIGSEVVTLGTFGSVGFHFGSPASCREVERALGFVRSRGYFKDWEPSHDIDEG